MCWVFGRDLFFPRDSTLFTTKKTWQPHKVSESPICSELRRTYKKFNSIERKYTHTDTRKCSLRERGTRIHAHTLIRRACMYGLIILYRCRMYSTRCPCTKCTGTRKSEPIHSDRVTEQNIMCRLPSFTQTHKHTNIAHGTRIHSDGSIERERGWWNDEPMSTVNQNDKNTTTKRTTHEMRELNGVASEIQLKLPDDAIVVYFFWIRCDSKIRCIFWNWCLKLGEYFKFSNKLISCFWHIIQLFVSMKQQYFRWFN